MRKETQAGHTPTHSENTNNQTRTRTDRDRRGDRNRSITRKKTNSGILNIFKGRVLEVGAMLRTKDENYK